MHFVQKRGRQTFGSCPGAANHLCSARERAEKVKQLLRELGESNEHLPLAKRHRTITRRMESSDLDELTADLYGQLTLAVHDLNCLLRDAFYR